MPDLAKGKATICIVHYKTPDFIRLCLRSIRKFTTYPFEVIVVDNGSDDESIDYLRTLTWIRLLERNNKNKPGGGYSHAAGLDSGLENCRTEFFVSMHSDTFVQKKNWLTELIGYFNNDEDISCVGSGKVELAGKWRIFLRKATDYKTFRRRLLNTPDAIGKYRYYNRTICCLYRTGILRRENLSFLMDRDKGLTAGKKMYFELVDRGYKTVELPPEIMKKYIIHLAHATQVINPQEFTLRKRTTKKCCKLIDKIMSSETVQNILSDNSLDK